jgi:hypothetical protein
LFWLKKYPAVGWFGGKRELLFGPYFWLSWKRVVGTGGQGGQGGQGIILKQPLFFINSNQL